MTHTKSNLLRRPGAWLVAGSVLALTTLTACLGGGGGGGPDPDQELCPDSYVAGTYDSLHVPLCVMLDTGAVLYEGTCNGCHNNGRGSAGGVPPHFNADYVQQHKRSLIEILLAGYTDSLKVNGLWYEGYMPGFGESFTNMELASILTHIRVAMNDSTVGACDATQLDEDGFAKCEMTPRSVATRKADSVSVQEVKVVRDSLAALPR